MSIFVALIKASAIATLAFALSWIRIPHFVESVRIAGKVLIEYLIPLEIMGLVFGFPIAALLLRCRVLSCWWYTAVGEMIGALLGFPLAYTARTAP